MKVKAVAKLNDGMSEAAANQLWKDIEGFAAYGFNASHSFSLYTAVICLHVSESLLSRRVFRGSAYSRESREASCYFRGYEASWHISCHAKYQSFNRRVYAD